MYNIEYKKYITRSDVRTSRQYNADTKQFGPYMKIFVRVCVFSFLLAFTSNFAQNTLQGIVADSLTKESLVGASLYFMGTSIGSATNIEGEYKITHVPDGNFKVRVSYVGYSTKDINIILKGGQTLELFVQLAPAAIQGKTITVTAQAAGQAAAINQQFSSNTIVNVISEEKIQQLPDANAAEAIGRLPGVSITRSGGEANKIVLRGLSDKFSTFTIDGVRIAPTDADARGVDLSTISQGSLAGIELFKALTPDKDADAIAGSVNLVTRKAPSQRLLRVDAKGAYDGMDKYSGQYEFALRYGERFFNDVLGVQVTGNLERRDRSNEAVNVQYSSYHGDVSQYQVTNLGLDYANEIRKRGGLGGIIDINTPDGGSIKVSNIFNKTSRDYVDYTIAYPTSGFREPSTVYYGARARLQNISQYNSSINGDNYLFGFKANWSLSFAESISDYDHDYRLQFQEQSGTDANGNVISGMGKNIPSPFHGPLEQLPTYAVSNFSKSVLYEADINGERNYDKEKTAFLNLLREYSIGNQITGEFKFGGKYRENTRYRDESELIAPYYNLPFSKYQLLPGSTTPTLKDFSGTRFQDVNDIITNNGIVTVQNFLDPSPASRNLFDKYYLYPMINRDAILQWYDPNKYGYESTNGLSEYQANGLMPVSYYYITERVSSGYLMNTSNIGQDLTVIFGARAESENNDYYSRYAKQINGTYVPGVLPSDLKDTTATHKETVWLLNLQTILRPTDYMNVRLAAYQALARPDFSQRLVNFSPIANATLVGTTDGSNGAFYIGNPKLKAAVAWNYELNTSFFSNTIGLFSVSVFYKNIKNMYHSINGTLIDVNQAQSVLDSLGIKLPFKNPYIGKRYDLYYTYNSNKFTGIWGIEVEHQANLRFLPGLLQNIVVNYNFSFIKSETWIPTSKVITSYIPDPDSPGDLIPVTKNILYESRQKLEGQPEFYGNLALGYDLGGFSGRVSVFYQDQYDLSYSPDGRNDIIVNSFTRLDLALKQEITDKVSVMLNINNITNVEEGTSIKNRVGGWTTTSGQKTDTLLQSSQRYGITADLGVRISL